MRFYPYEEFVIRTPLSVVEQKKALFSEVETKGAYFPFFSNHKYFRGTVDDRGFRIIRIIAYKNSFLPQVEGVFHPGRVVVKMKLFVLVQVILLVFAFALCAGFIASLFPPSLDSFGPLIMFVLLYLFVTFAFGYEVKKQKKYLALVFRGKVE